MASGEFRLQVGYGLTTAEIHYHLPDYPNLLQLYVWQEYDLAPELPTLQGFLKLLGARTRRRFAFRARRASPSDPPVGMAGGESGCSIFNNVRPIVDRERRPGALWHPALFCR